MIHFAQPHASRPAVLHRATQRERTTPPAPPAASQTPSPTPTPSLLTRVRRKLKA